MESKGKIILAEKDKLVLETEKLILESSFPGYSIEEAKTYEVLEGQLEKACESKKGVKLFIIDEDFPMCNQGRKIAEDYSFKSNVPIVLTTFYNELVREGKVFYLEKPFLNNSFARTIKEILN